jgi:23S rRNA (cytidine1920-2'-O)/16S rRNA (cytidine1409-2'-O)-methyltransferase
VSLITETRSPSPHASRDSARRADTVQAMAKQRLDTLMAERGLFPSRSRAAASVMAGEVYLGAADAEPARRRRAGKPGELVDVEAQVSVAERPRFVSRGGIKLANALRESGLQVAGRWALDVGASTGGFTDCLLQQGVSGVVAVDVGYGVLDYRLRVDGRVAVMERTNARALTPELLPSPPAGCRSPSAGAQPSTETQSLGAPAAGRVLPDLATIDVSFISLAKVLGAVLGCLAGKYDVLAMVKPQFEVGRGKLGKGGVVRDAADRRAALVSVGEAARGLGAEVLGYYSSGLAGPKGNKETFVWLAESGRAGGAASSERLEQMAGEVER